MYHSFTSYVYTEENVEKKQKIKTKMTEILSLINTCEFCIRGNSEEYYKSLVIFARLKHGSAFLKEIKFNSEKF